MQTTSVTPVDQRLFALLRAALHDTQTDVTLFRSLTDTDWKSLYQQAARQGVMALAWDGLVLLPADSQPPRGLKLMWGLEVQRYEERYARYVRTLAKLSAFYAEHGIATVQLKGVGYSACYPLPAHREGGDIDIFTFSADPAKLTDAEANALADELMVQQGIAVDTRTSKKHSHFDYEGISIENHKMFLNGERYALARRLDPVLRRELRPQSTLLSCGPSAPDERYTVLTPSYAFNAIFIAFHAAQHYGTGLALHHLFDWACLLRRQPLQLPEEALAEPAFMQAIGAFNHLCATWLDIDAPRATDPAVLRLSEEMLQEMLHPAFSRTVPTRNRVGIIWYKLRRFINGTHQADKLLGMTPWQRFRYSVVAHIRRPDTIFGSL